MQNVEVPPFSWAMMKLCRDVIPAVAYTETEAKKQLPRRSGLSVEDVLHDATQFRAFEFGIGLTGLHAQPRTGGDGVAVSCMCQLIS